jgi:small ligand-binding sensory domain FIST
MIVTAADRNVLLELAGVPAMTRLDQILRSLPPEDQALASAGLQIGVAMDEYADEHASGDFLIRAVLGSCPTRRASRSATSSRSAAPSPSMSATRRRPTTTCASG